MLFCFFFLFIYFVFFLFICVMSECFNLYIKKKILLENVEHVLWCLNKFRFIETKIQFLLFFCFVLIHFYFNNFVRPPHWLIILESCFKYTFNYSFTFVSLLIFIFFFVVVRVHSVDIYLIINNNLQRIFELINNNKTKVIEFAYLFVINFKLLFEINKFDLIYLMSIMLFTSFFFLPFMNTIY